MGSIRYYTDVYGWPGGLVQWAGESYVRRTKSHPGRNVFDAEWDLLVLLDACRVDLLSEMRDEYDFVGEMETFDSLGSSTAEWMEATFDGTHGDALRRTAYVCANPFSRQYLREGDFALLDEVWRYAWDEDLGTVPPRPVTDRAISAARSGDYDRILVHYLQPHVPFIAAEGSPRLNMANFGGREEDLVPDDWTRIRRGEQTLDAVWDDYGDNLRLVLDDVSLLLDSVDANEVVISADHGNAAGEYGIYGHPDGLPIRCLRQVPWVETTASDSRDYVPDAYDREARVDVESRLEALGYRDAEK